MKDVSYKMKLKLTDTISFLYSIKWSKLLIIFQTFYVVGSNNTQTVFRVLRINRMDPCELIIVDDKMEYSNEEIKSFFQKIDSKTSKSTNKYVSAFGIVG